MTIRLSRALRNTLSALAYKPSTSIQKIRIDLYTPIRYLWYMITHKELQRKIRQACKKAGSQRKWALNNGLSPQYVNDVLRGYREPSDKIAKALGYERVEGWELEQK